jgi:ornithine carbamoyltransferase
MRHFLTLLDITPEEAGQIMARATELKLMQKNGTPHRTLAGKTLGMIFDKASTRTRGMHYSYTPATRSWGAASQSPTPPASCRACSTAS